MKSHVEYKNYQYKQIVMFYMGISDTDMTTSLYLISALLLLLLLEINFNSIMDK